MTVRWLLLTCAPLLVLQGPLKIFKQHTVFALLKCGTYDVHKSFSLKTLEKPFKSFRISKFSCLFTFSAFCFKAQIIQEIIESLIEFQFFFTFLCSSNKNWVQTQVGFGFFFTNDIAVQYSKKDESSDGDGLSVKMRVL